MRPAVPYESAESTRHRTARRRELASSPGHYGLERLEVRAVEGAGFILRLHFVPHSVGEGEDIPPELEMRHLRVWDDDGRPVPVRARSLERPPDAPDTLEASFVLERGSLAELRHRLLTLVLTGLESVDPFFDRAHFQLTLERDAPPAAPGPALQPSPELPPA
ncbi:MAG: hypothetical protein ACXU86_06345, partial [Archangium sp.]